MTAAPVRLVLLHGVGLDRSVWSRLTPLLDRSFEVHCLDLPGHGRAAPVADGVDLAGLAAPVVEQIPPRSHLVGFSLGALVAQHLAARRPDLVASLTSVSSVCNRTTAEQAAVRERLECATQDLDASTRASLSRWFEGTDVPSVDVDHTRRVLEANDPQQFLRCYRVFAHGDADVWPDLGSIRAPSLAITGSDDPGSTPDMTYRLKEAISECVAIVIPGARHMLPLHKPRALAHHLNDFIGGRDDA